MSYSYPYYSSNPYTQTVGAHPILFGLVGCLAVVEVGLLAYFIDQVKQDKYFWPSDEYEHRTIFLLFTASWTALGAILNWLFSMFLGSLWTFVTWLFWLVGAILFHEKNNIRDLDCDDTPFASICRIRVASEAIAWTEMGLLVLLFFAGLHHVHNTRDYYGGYNNAFWRGYYGH